jgi:hypothetical protein
MREDLRSDDERQRDLLYYGPCLECGQVRTVKYVRRGASVHAMLVCPGCGEQ